MTYQEAINSARQQLAALYAPWGQASDAEIVAKIQSDPTIFAAGTANGDAIRQALGLMAAPTVPGGTFPTEPTLPPTTYLPTGQVQVPSFIPPEYQAYVPQGWVPDLATQQFWESIRQQQAEFGESVRQFGLSYALQQATQTMQQAAVTGYYQQQPTFEREQFAWQQQQALEQLLANPRYFAQSLQALGQTPAQVGQFLQQTPLVQGLVGGQMPTTTPEGRNPLFPFVGGRAVPAREALEWQRTGSSMVPLLSSLASFSGQTPEAFWGEWQEFLPKGTATPLTRFI